MKAITSLLALAAVAQAHYSFPSLVSGGTTTTPWQYVRQWTGYYTYSPVQSVTSTDIRCNVAGSTTFAPGTLPVAAGSTVSFTADPNIYHPGPALVYMAKVPSGKTAANWDGSGSVWVCCNIFLILSQTSSLGTFTCCLDIHPSSKHVSGRMV